VRVATEQVNDWGLGYIDLYLIHFPVALEYNPKNTRVSWWHKIPMFWC
jgi:D-xylose reductase